MIDGGCRNKFTAGGALVLLGIGISLCAMDPETKKKKMPSPIGIPVVHVTDSALAPKTPKKSPRITAASPKELEMARNAMKTRPDHLMGREEIRREVQYVRRTQDECITAEIASAMGDGLRADARLDNDEDMY